MRHHRHAGRLGAQTNSNHGAVNALELLCQCAEIHMLTQLIGAWQHSTTRLGIDQRRVGSPVDTGQTTAQLPVKGIVEGEIASVVTNGQCPFLSGQIEPVWNLWRQSQDKHG
jgi:hypothetical protein